MLALPSVAQASSTAITFPWSMRGEAQNSTPSSISRGTTVSAARPTMRWSGRWGSTTRTRRPRRLASASAASSPSLGTK